MNLEPFFKVSYGLYIVSSYDDKKLNGQLVNVFFQITADPIKFAVCINKQNLTYELIKKNKVFTVSVLNQDTPMEFIRLFGFKSGKDIDKFENIKYKTGITGAPVVLENANAYFECELENSLDVGTHVIFTAKVIDSQIIGKSEPLTYDYYYKVKKGFSSKKAPTFFKQNKQIKKEVEKNMKKYKCTVCSYIYDPEKGDPDSGAEPGTAFADLPEDWVCPECGVGKDQFEVED